MIILSVILTGVVIYYLASRYKEQVDDNVIPIPVKSQRTIIRNLNDEDLDNFLCNPTVDEYSSIYRYALKEAKRRGLC